MPSVSLKFDMLQAGVHVHMTFGL